MATISIIGSPDIYVDRFHQDLSRSPSSNAQEDIRTGVARLLPDKSGRLSRSGQAVSGVEVA